MSRSRTKNVIIDCIAILAIVGFPHLNLIPNFGFSIPILLMVWLVLKYSGEKFSDIGFRWKSFSVKSLLIGILFGGFIFCFNQLFLMPTLDSVFELSSNDIGVYSFIEQGLVNLIFLMILGVLVGGFYEEIVFHGFIFTRIEKWIPGNSKTIISFLITAILFSLYHLQMGANGTINAFVAGMFYQGIYLYFKRNLWYSIIAHGTYNSIVMTSIYLGYL